MNGNVNDSFKATTDRVDGLEGVDGVDEDDDDDKDDSRISFATNRLLLSLSSSSSSSSYCWLADEKVNNEKNMEDVDIIWPTLSPTCCLLVSLLI